MWQAIIFDSKTLIVKKIIARSTSHRAKNTVAREQEVGQSGMIADLGFNPKIGEKLPDQLVEELEPLVS